jgi:hypothetical protein
LVKNNPADLTNTKDKLGWKWIKGTATTTGDFGTPLSSTNYLLCIYTGSTPTLVTSALAPAGGTCAGKPCWKGKPTGFIYKDKDLTPNGLLQIVLKSGLDGKAKIIVKGKGANLQTPALPISQPVTVQLKSSDGVCWEAVYSAPATKSDTTVFKDKAD